MISLEGEAGHNVQNRDTADRSQLYADVALAFIDAKVNIPALLASLGMMMDLHIQNRERLPNLRLRYPHFEEVTRSVASAAERIFARAGLELTEKARHASPD